VEPGGLWDAERYEVRAMLKRDGEPAGEFPLAYAGSISQFEAVLRIEQPGIYEAIVYAYDHRNGNTGVDRATFIVAE